MKHFLLLVAILFSMQAYAQTAAEKAASINRHFAGMKPGTYTQLVTRSAKTHTLDSIVSSDEFGNTRYRVEFEYDDQGRATTMLQYELDSLTSTIELYSRITQFYQGTSDPSRMTIELRDDSTGQLETILDFELYYSAPGRLDSAVISQEDPFTGEFSELIGQKNVYEGDLLVATRQYFYISFLGGWVNSGETIFTYDDNDLLILEESTTLDFGTFSIVPLSRTVYSYNANNLRDTATTYFYEDPNYVLDSRIIYEYYPSGLVQNIIEQSYFNGEWVNELWTENHQGVINNVVDQSIYRWDFDNWLKTDSTHHILNTALPFEDVYTANPLSFLSTGEGFFDFIGGFEYAIAERYYHLFSETTGQINYTEHDVFYYSQFEPSAVVNVLPDFITVTPNPATDFIQISLRKDTDASIMMTSLSGQLIRSGRLTEGTNVFEVSGVAPGIYMMLITLEDGLAYAHKQIIK